MADRASTLGRAARIRDLPPHGYFVVSALFHYLGPALAVLLFRRVDVLGVAWRRPWRALPRLDRDSRLTLLAWGGVLAVMNCCFYLAIARLPLGTVAAIEFVPVIALAAAGARTARNVLALSLAAPGVYLLTHVQVVDAPLGVALAAANPALLTPHTVLRH